MESLPNDIQRLSLYFLLMIPDDETARNAAKESYREVRRQTSASAGEAGNIPAFVALLHTTWLRFKRKYAKIKQPVVTGAGWIVREDWDLETWLRFRRSARDEEVEAVLFGEVFRISDIQVARGLDISVGTARARRQRGLLKLSTILHQQKMRANA